MRGRSVSVSVCVCIQCTYVGVCVRFVVVIVFLEIYN